MTVLYLGPVPPQRGGISQHGARIVEALRDDGHEVTVESWRDQYPRLLYRRPEVDPDAAPFPGTRRRLRWWNPLGWLAVRRVARSHDTVILPWTTPFPTPVYLTVTWRSPAAVAVMVHNALPHERFPFAPAFARLVLRRADRLVCHASSVADDCHRLAPDVPVSVVPHPPDLATSPTPLPGGPIRLLALGYLRDYKGTDLALRAVAACRDAGAPVRLTVAGEPWGDAEPWVALVDELDLDDLVDLRLRYQSDDEVHELLRTHHALVAPYRSATQSGVVAQALGSGRPAVVTGVGGLPDVVTEGHNGTVCPPDDVAALTEAIRRLVGDLPRLAAGAAATATATSWSTVATTLTGAHA